MSQEAMLALGLFLAGVVGVPAIEGIKSLVEALGGKLEGLPALYTSGGVSIVLSGIVLWLSGAFSQPFSWELVGGSITAVFTIATVVYKHLADKIKTARDLAAYDKFMSERQP